MSTFNHLKYKPFPPIQLPDRSWPDKSIQQAPTWCSVDLRDGNQALIEPMTVAQKQKLYHLLVEIGLKEIEVGFPAASKPDYDFVRWLIEEKQIPDDVTIQVLVQARVHLIHKTFAALKGAKKAIIHLYNSTSTVQRDKVFKLDRQGIIHIAQNGAREIKKCAAAAPETQWQFQYSPESFTGTEPEFALEICEAVKQIWQPTIDNPVILNLPSTVEMATPNVYADQIEWFCRHISNREAVIISVHTHNDRGCGVAAAELAMMAGADRAEGTLLGNGERTGNMDILVMAMNLYSQGIDSKLNLSDMDKIVAVAEQCTQIETHPRHPYAGDLVFTAFSGSHQDAIKKCLANKDEKLWEVAYLPIDPQDIGRTYQDVIRVNSQSGKGGIAYVMESQFNCQLPRWLQIEFSRVVQQEAESSSQEVSPEKIWQLFEQYYLHNNSPLKLKNFSLEKTDKDRFTAHLLNNKQAVSINGEGNGILAAFTHSLKKELQLEFEIIEYGEHALSQGSDAKAVSYIQLKYENQRFSGVAIDRDIVTSSLNALVRSVNQLISCLPLADKLIVGL